MSYHSQSNSHTQSTPQTSSRTQSVMLLSSQLHTLSQRTQQLEELTRVAAAQSDQMKLLAANQAAWFMAAQKIFIPQDQVEVEGQHEQQQQREK